MNSDAKATAAGGRYRFAVLTSSSQTLLDDRPGLGWLRWLMAGGASRERAAVGGAVTERERRERSGGAPTRRAIKLKAAGVDDVAAPLCMGMSWFFVNVYKMDVAEIQ